MRRIISFMVMVCVLHTQTYYAAYDGVNASSSSAWQGVLVKQPVDLESGGKAAAESKPFGIDVVGALKHHAATLKEHAATLKHHVSAFVKTPAGLALTFLAGAALVLCSIYVCMERTHAHLSAYDSFNTCLNFLENGKELERTRYFAHYEHATTSNGISLVEALPLWFNNATNLVSSLGTLVLAQRSVGQTGYTDLYEFENNFKKFLFASGVSNLLQNSRCTFKLGDTPATDAITGCQHDPQKDLYTWSSHTPDDADALIQFRRQDDERGLKSPDDLSVRLTFNRKAFRDQRYPELDYSPDHGQLDEAACFSMQRRLLQLGNGLPLAAAVKDRVQNHLQIMAQLTAILSKLRFRETVDANDAAALSSLVRSVFTANQLALTSDVGCDVGVAGGQFNLLECFEGSYANVPTGASVPEDAQVWFVRNWANAVFNVVAIANSAPVTEAMAVWLKQSADAMHSLWVVANTLHQHVCNGTTDRHLALLGKAAQHQLRSRNAYLQGDLGCDIRLGESGVGEMVCHSGTAPVTNETCELESDIPVRWEGKLWLKPHPMDPSLIEGTTVSVNTQWQGSRSGTRPYSPSVLESPEVSASETGESETAEETDSVSDSDTLGTASESDSADVSAEVSTSGSGSGTTHTPSLPNANTTQGDGITELYYVDGNNENVMKAFFNATHMLNDTLFLSRSAFGAAVPFRGLHIDSIRYKIYWTTNNALLKIYSADISSNPMELNNIRIIYSTSELQVYSLYIANTVGRAFWTTQDGGIYMGSLNITHPATITNVTSESMITKTGNAPYGLYYHPPTQALLWTRQEVSPTRYPIYISTLNLQTNMLMNTNIFLNESSLINSLSYDTKNRRLIFSTQGNRLNIAPFSFENPLPLTSIAQIPSFGAWSISVVND